jgi:hypothetical protein
MINYFRKVVFGFQVKTKKIDGIEVKLNYKGTLTSVNPVQKVKECISIVEECSKEESYSSSKELSNIWENRDELIDGLTPLMTAKFKLNGKDFEVKRYVKKFNKKPESLYQIKKGNIDFAIHITVYDHGYFYSDIKKKFLERVGFKNLESNSFVNNSKTIGVHFDVFGHSRIVLWNNNILN